MNASGGDVSLGMDSAVLGCRVNISTKKNYNRFSALKNFTLFNQIKKKPTK
jgi:hypothetical protein